MPDAAIDVVLFDLGGVLVDFGGVEPMKRLSGIDDDDELWRRWLTCEWVRSFERGTCSIDEFAEGVVTEWQLDLTPAQYIAEFRSWIGGPFDGAEELVVATSAVARVGCLSNTNALHTRDHWERWPLFTHFELPFLSFELGCVKPDREIFDRVAVAIGIAGERILFLDDNAMNVDGANAGGWQARRAVGVEGARQALAEFGVL